MTQIKRPAESKLVTLETKAMGRGTKGARLQLGPWPSIYCYEQEIGFAYFHGRGITADIDRDEALRLIERSMEKVKA